MARNCGEIQRFPHRLEHVREVVGHEVQRRGAVDRERVVEALVPLDELLDGDGVDLLAAEQAQRRGQPGVVVDPRGVERAGTGPRLEDERVADRPARSRAPRRRWRPPWRRPSAPRRPAASPSSTACRGTATPSAPTSRGSSSSRGPARRPWCGTRWWPRGGPRTVLVLDPADGVGHHADVGHVRDDVVVRQPGAELVVEPLLRAVADPDDRGTDLGQGSHELALRRREGRIDEDHVHAGEPRRTRVRPPGPPPSRSSCRAPAAPGVRVRRHGRRRLRRAVPAGGHGALRLRRRGAAGRPARPGHLRARGTDPAGAARAAGRSLARGRRARPAPAGLGGAAASRGRWAGWTGSSARSSSCRCRWRRSASPSASRAWTCGPRSTCATSRG